MAILIAIINKIKILKKKKSLRISLTWNKIYTQITLKCWMKQNKTNGISCFG